MVWHDSRVNALRILRRDDHDEMPWLNGEGSTLQVMTSPEGAGLTEFDWRVSFARVERSGPFSRFEGVDRVITLVEGAALVLTVDDGSGPRVVELGHHQPFAFAGEAEVACEVSGATLDLNLMTRRGRVVGEVRAAVVGDGPLVVEPEPGEDLLVAVLEGPVTASAGSTGPERLEQLDVVVSGGEPLTLGGDGVVAVLRVTGRDG